MPNSDVGLRSSISICTLVDLLSMPRWTDTDKHKSKESARALRSIVQVWCLHFSTNELQAPRLCYHYADRPNRSQNHTPVLYFPSTSMAPFPFVCPFMAPASSPLLSRKPLLGTPASLSIICLVTPTMLSSINS